MSSKPVSEASLDNQWSILAFAAIVEVCIGVVLMLDPALDAAERRIVSNEFSRRVTIFSNPLRREAQSVCCGCAAAPS
jgi:hypothetical protein